MRLADYYTDEYAERALDCYLGSVPRTWGLDHKLDLYSSAKVAFDSNATQEVKQRAFNHIYKSLEDYWMVFYRAAGPCWSAEKTFAVLTTQCEPCSRRSPLTAMNLIDSRNYQQIVEACLSHMGPIKPTKDYPQTYPWMAVSKFLHFFNPRLFPIYDETYVWKKVASGVFKPEYGDFCRSHGFRLYENTSRFNLQYTMWASRIMQGAEDECMPVFVRWFASKVAGKPDPQGVLKDLDTYYASAFEMIAIGAAFLEA